LLEVNSTPIVIFKIKIEHFISNLSIFELTTINDHRLPKYGSVVIFSWQDIDTFSFQYIISLLNCVVNSNLVRALTDLSLSVEHETSAECINLVIEWARCVGLSPLDALLGIVIYVFPLWFVIFDVVRFKASDSQLRNFFISIVIESSHQICSMVHGSQRRAFSRSWLPVIDWHFNNSYIETFSFLHSLNVCLKTSCKLLYQLVSWNIISWLSDEKLWTIVILIR